VTAVLLAVAAALAFAVATVAQHRGATSAGDGPGRGALVARLLRSPVWLAGQVAAVLGFALHAVALRSGPLVVVQPLLAGGLVLALALGALVDRRHADRRLPGRAEWAAAAAVATGLALFLLAARPAAGAPAAALLPTTACAVASLAVSAAAALWGRRPGRPHRALVLGVAAGLGFGVTGLLLKELMGGPLLTWPAGWTALELSVVGLVSLLTAQWAYRAGPLIESLPVTTVLEPAVALVVSGPLFGEQLAGAPLARAGQLAGALAAAVGIVVLARRAARRDRSEPAPAVRHPRALRPARAPQPGRAA
jgi:hypothetical protein